MTTIRLTPAQLDAVSIRAEADYELAAALRGRGLALIDGLANRLTEHANAEDGAAEYWAARHEHAMARFARGMRDALTNAARAARAAHG